MFTKYQSAYFAHWLTQTGKVHNQVSRAMASARVDMNPHQVEAACFALKSPIEKGVLLADEVGLGKTIEASLVIAQKWAEQKRKILLVVPASLRKQWNQELLDKFELPSTIVDSKIANELKKAGIADPFEQDDQVIISSYEYVAGQKDRVGRISWDLVVFDEAHKLRNVYQKRGGKRAKSISEATENAASRVLLSATPIQNNLMELYGLSQVIDPHFFGDEKSFRILYVNRKKNKEALLDLTQRIKPLCHRTLRRQVQLEGGINFTNRYALTEDFTPSAEEWDLYQQLSEYLQAPDNQAINPKAKHLVSIGLRKTLASSSFAVAATLKGMVQRLRDRQLLDEDSLTDLEEADDWGDNDFGELASTSSHKTEKLKLEIELLNSFHELALGIEKNAKGEALLKVLMKAMDMTESLGGQKKAVVFTESRRTQQYLYELLRDNGYQDRIVQLNGSNTDSDSLKTYKDWLERHANSARISGSKSADMKAALVERFKSDEADILISTEAGGEGINLQFCSILVNYDLPWNPQKVEQRIGRVHRYGQKNDVVVVNFVNRRNPADQRVFQLLNEKLKLFEGVFGASDEVLGAISSSIDIEQRIYQIYQHCRTDTEIEQQFDELQEDMKGALEIREASARESLMVNFDRDVVATLKNTRDSSHDFLQEYERVLLDLAKAELPEAKIENNHFFYQNRRYDLSWHLAEKNGSEFFRLQATEHFLAWDLVKRAQNYPLTSTRLEFYYGQLVGEYAALKELMGQSGDIAVFDLSFTYNLGRTKTSQLFVIAKTDTGAFLSEENAAHLLCIPAQEAALDKPICEQALSAEMDDIVDKQKLLKEDELDDYLEQESTKLERWAEDRRKALMEAVDELDEQIRQFKKDARQLASTKEKIEAKKSLRKLERKRDDELSEYHSAKKGIELEEDKLLDDVSDKLELSCNLRPLFSARWTLKP